MIPNQLLEEVADLQKVGYQIQLNQVGNQIFIVFENFPLPNGYTANQTKLMVFTQVTYPYVPFDMFWTSIDLTLESGLNQHATTPDTQMGITWKRFSIHPYHNVVWNPLEDNLCKFLVYVNQRLNFLG